ncbi:RNA-directed DNA polymerase [Marinilactibacillus psychrotolerans]|uniref:RNA-directed DNA polymerase n=1 Tax=Marinilactibacillus psychrotolerans TaxID=191770 RepID=UPI0039AF5F93
MKKHDINNLYNTIFDVSFLVRYGYYDVKMKKVESSKIEDEELEDYYGEPDSFYMKLLNLRELEKLLKIEDFRRFYDFNIVKKNVDTEPINFNIPKSNYARREYKMTNLYSYLELSFFMVDNKSEFINIFNKNLQSTSKFFNNLDFNYQFTKKIEKRLLFGGNNLLSLDLSNFYHTLYTHSIPWVVHGKQKSKVNRTTGFENNLDKIIQHCQYGETYGIPTGSITSRIIAEFYMCHIDLRLHNKGYKYARYVDDIQFPYTIDNQREVFMSDFNALCREYNLVLNDKKTEINKFPFENDKQKTEIFSYFDDMNKNTKVDNWIKQISQFLDLCMSEESNENKGAIKCIFSVPLNRFKYNKISTGVLNQIFIKREKVTNFNVFEQFLDISLKDSKLTNKFISFTEQLIESGVKQNSLKIIVKRYFKENQTNFRNILENCKENGWNQEVYQILLYTVIFEDKKLVTKKILLNILRSELDDYSKCLSIILWLKKNYKVEQLLKILEEELKFIHNTYDDKSVRMQEKYWLLRYFIYYLIDQGIFSNLDINLHFSKFSKDSNGDVQSELNKYYSLSQNNSMNNGRKKINKFYEFLLSKNIPLVHLGTNNEFKYF